MNTVNDKIQDLISQIGPVFPDIDAVIQTEDPSWAIQFVDELVVMIEQLEHPDRMVFSSEIGTVADDQELPIYEALLCYNLLWKDTGGLSVYETLLCYNLLWRDTGGVKMALGGPEGEILLIYEMYMQETNLNEFKTVLLNFLNIAKVWEVFIQSEDSSMDEIAHDSLDMLNLSA